ncbi:MAG: hypothetical protein V4612_00205 [Pseudomonadota bacterium]
MKIIRQSNSFIRDLKKVKKRSKNLDKLYLIVEKLAKDQPKLTRIYSDQ